MNIIKWLLKKIDNKSESYKKGWNGYGMPKYTIEFQDISGGTIAYTIDGGTRFFCGQCDKPYVRKGNLEKHIDKVHGKNK